MQFLQFPFSWKNLLRTGRSWQRNCVLLQALHTTMRNQKERNWIFQANGYLTCTKGQMISFMEKIKDENQWGKLEKVSEKPNWICKDCYDGGIIVERHSLISSSPSSSLGWNGFPVPNCSLMYSLSS